MTNLPTTPRSVRLASSPPKKVGVGTKMRILAPTVAILLLAGCSTVELGIGGGGLANGYDFKDVATSFADDLRSKGFDVTQSNSNSSVGVHFMHQTVAGEATFSPVLYSGGCMHGGYSYSFSTVDYTNSWSNRRRVNQILKALEQMDRDLAFR
jgi:hypothetical protein